MTVFDWLEGVALPTGTKPFDVVELRFKANRKGFYRVGDIGSLQVGDVVVVDADPGEDVGVVSLRGELVRAQMRAKKVRDDHEVKKVLRKANQEDIDRWQQARLREESTVTDARAIIRNLNLQMKLSDVEYQGDGRKATFYYTAEDRVDFRILVRELAGAFGVRVEMRQIGSRQEAARVGGIGVCGRELCCSSWLTDFRSVSTQAARYQQLSLNPQKLAGQCGKLKCCLNFELDQYVEAVKDFPSPNTKLKVASGRVVVFKMDIFKRLVYLLPLDEQGSGPVAVTVEDMKELMAMNARGEVPNALSDFAIEEEHNEIDDVYSNVVGQDSLNRFDEKQGRKKRRPKGRPSGDRGGRGNGADKPAEKAAAPTKGTPAKSENRPPKAEERSGEREARPNRIRNRNRNRSDRNRGGNNAPQSKGE
jgi:cell fate regulator YaaT (PSP1 superfamily)